MVNQKDSDQDLAKKQEIIFIPQQQCAKDQE